MSIDQIPVFSVLRSTMRMLTARQKVLAENIANADTPGFTPKDIDEKSFHRMLNATQSSRSSRSKMIVTDSRHFSGSGGTGVSNVKLIETPGRETTMNGNSVVLEEQVSELAATRARYDAAIGLYQKSLGLIRMAIKTPGR
ncbi:MAG: flagellar basal body rod protein FlgB [Robiginitomaculum sp.]|nr:flagellar basal body rod protein FlgB [Robiginitomaculum sp.]